MALNMLKPRLKVIPATTRVKLLETKAGTTERIRGRTWMTTRRAVLMRDNYRCAGCGIVRADNECDHTVPLEQGGSNDMCNLQTLCGGPDGCHTRKTAAEAKARAGS
jgi:5-methylcytosine-specific restriction protein A